MRCLLDGQSHTDPHGFKLFSSIHEVESDTYP